MAAWMNVVLADIERGLRDPDNGLVIEIFALAEKHTGIHRVELYTGWITSMFIFLLFGFATESISVFISLTFTLVFIYKRMVNPKSSFKLPKLSHLFCLFVLADSFILPHHPVPSLILAFYCQVKRILQFRFFFALSYRPIRAVNNPGSKSKATVKGTTQASVLGLREKEIKVVNESLDHLALPDILEQEAIAEKEERLSNFFATGLQGQWHEYKNLR